jgi:hypothetical protein
MGNFRPFLCRRRALCGDCLRDFWRSIFATCDNYRCRARQNRFHGRSGAQRAVIRTLKDPASAQFGRIFDGRGVVGMATVCREVNAKNGFGGYTGMTPFVYFPDDDRAELITNPATLQMTKEGINAYFKDCRTS